MASQVLGQKCDCCEDEGGAWILKLRPDGSVRRQYEITHGSRPWNVMVQPLDSFGSGLAALGDLDSDGRVELAIGSPNSRGLADCDSGSVTGALGSVLLLFAVH